MMSKKIKNKHRLKRKQAKAVLRMLEEMFQESFSIPIDSLEVGEIDDYIIYLLDNKPIIMNYKNKVIFTIYGLLTYRPHRYYVQVDMGAIRFVTNGADVMAPGIVAADEVIKKDDIVWICDETHHKPLAIGIALMDGEEMVQQSKGKSVQLIHYIGDSLWEMIQEN